jgi:hypothetical protein
MLVLALRETLVGLGAQATLLLAALHWQQQFPLRALLSLPLMTIA